MTQKSPAQEKKAIEAALALTEGAFTSAFKELEPIPQFKATAQLGEFLGAQFSQSF